MIIDLDPYIKNISAYYFYHKDPDTDVSIWTWMEQDYRTRRRLHWPCTAMEFYNGRKFELVFDNDADALFFISKWS